jgi:hypothetical protein
MLVNEVLTPQREIPLYLKPTAPGKREEYKGTHDFVAAISRLPNPKPKKIRQDIGTTYWVNKKDQVVAKWESFGGDAATGSGFVIQPK